MAPDALLLTVLKKITPSPEEERAIASVIKEVTKAAEKCSDVPFTLAGSYLRGTWMTDKKEFDVFLLFPEHAEREALEKRGLTIGKKIMLSLGGTQIVAYAEHPYTRGSYKGFAIDIVPCYKVADPSNIKSAVDRTPFHNQYLSRHFPPPLSGEARLLKQLLKANGLYGSDAKTMGFSGYLCELLIVRFGSFKNLLAAASSWEPGTLIDLENHHPDKQLSQFKGQPLIVIDPVDPKRNVAAVLSPENFIHFVSLCKAFLKKPSESYFFRKKPTVSLPSLRRKIKSRGTLLIGVEFKRPDVIDDILYPQLRRTVRRLSSLLKDYEFMVLGSDATSTEKSCLLLFEMEVWSLPAVRKMIGPPIAVKKHAKEFLEKYRKARLQVDEGKWTAEIKRTFPFAEDLLIHSLRKKPKELQEMGIPSSVAQNLRGFRLLTWEKLLKRKEFLFFLKEFLERRIEI